MYDFNFLTHQITQHIQMEFGKLLLMTLKLTLRILFPEKKIQFQHRLNSQCTKFTS